MNSIRIPHPYLPVGATVLTCLLFCLAAGQARSQSTSDPDSTTTGRDRTMTERDVTATAQDRTVKSHLKVNRAEQRFLMRAHASGMREQKLSLLASTKAANPAVRTFAEKLMREHRQMSQDLAPLLGNAGLDTSLLKTNSTRTYPNPDVNPNPSVTTDTGGMTINAGTTNTGVETTHTGVITRQDGTAGNKQSGRWNRMVNDRQERKLMKQTGEKFDETYLEMVIDEHQDAVDLFEDAIDDDDVTVKDFAGKYLPVLRQHLEEAKRLEDTVD